MTCSAKVSAKKAKPPEGGPHPTNEAVGEVVRKFYHTGSIDRFQNDLCAIYATFASI